MDKKNTNIQGELKILKLVDRDYKTLFTKKFVNRKKYIAPDPKKMYSYIPGAIQKIFVKNGQKVKKGDSLLILESMKMLNIVRVPFEGKIKKINVVIGEKIPKDHLMVEFE